MPVGFYAGLRRSARQRALLLGPYATREEAGEHVERAHEAAMTIDPFCHFDEAGVFELDWQELPDGVLNSRIGLHDFG